MDVGVSWPEPRLIDNEDGTITDKLTGLIWPKNVEYTPMDWWSAINACNNIADDGMYLLDGSQVGDWRLLNCHGGGSAL